MEAEGAFFYTKEDRACDKFDKLRRQVFPDRQRLT